MPATITTGRPALENKVTDVQEHAGRRRLRSEGASKSLTSNHGTILLLTERTGGLTCSDVNATDRYSHG